MMRWKILLSLCVSFLFMLPGCDSENTNMLIFPGQFDERQMQSAQTHRSEDTYGSDITMREFPEEQTTIIAIGDSLTYGVRSPAGGYPAILQAKLTTAGYDAKVINEGIPGETSPETHDRFLHEIAGADVVLLMIGTNDLVNPGGCPIPFVCETLDHTSAMLDEALISKVTPLLSTVTPTTGDYSWANYAIMEHNASLHNLALEKGVTLVDNYMAIISNGSGEWLYEDGRVHFTDQGYEIIAQQWFDALVLNGLVELPQEE